MDGGRPTAGTGDAVGVQSLHGAAVLAGHNDPADRALALDGDDGAAAKHGYTGRLLGSSRSAVIHDGGDVDAIGNQRASRVVTAVAGCRDDHPAPTGHTVVRGITPHSASQHNARAVVVGKEHRPLECAGGQDNAIRTQFPQTLAHVATDRLHRRCHQMVVQAENSAAGLHFDANLQQIGQSGSRGCF